MLAIFEFLELYKYGILTAPKVKGRRQVAVRKLLPVLVSLFPALFLLTTLDRLWAQEMRLSDFLASTFLVFVKSSYSSYMSVFFLFFIYFNLRSFCSCIWLRPAYTNLLTSWIILVDGFALNRVERESVKRSKTTDIDSANGHDGRSSQLSIALLVKKHRKIALGNHSIE